MYLLYQAAGAYLEGVGAQLYLTQLVLVLVVLPGLLLLIVALLVVLTLAQMARRR